MNTLYIKRADTTIIYDPDAKGPVSLMVGDIRVRGEYKTKSSLSPELLSLLLSGLKPEYKKWDYENKISHISTIRSSLSILLLTVHTK